MCFPRSYQRRVFCYELPRSIDNRQCSTLKKIITFYTKRISREGWGGINRRRTSR